MKIKFNSDKDLSLRNTLALYNMIIVVRSVFHKGSKYYPKVLLHNFLYELWMTEYERIIDSEGIDVNRSNGLLQCIISHYWYFLETNFSQTYVIVGIN